MKKLNNKGLASVLIVVITLAVVAVGFAGYRVYENSKDKTADNQNTQADTSKQEAAPQPTTQTEQKDKNEGYLVIKEWGVKIKMKDSDKVTYVFDDVDAEDPASGESYDSSMALQVKDEFLQDKSCKVSVGWSRYPTLKDDFFIQRAKKIGDYYFISGGSPYNCGNDADNAINQSVRSDFGNLETL